MLPNGHTPPVSPVVGFLTTLTSTSTRYRACADEFESEWGKVILGGPTASEALYIRYIDDQDSAVATIAMQAVRAATRCKYIVTLEVRHNHATSSLQALNLLLKSRLWQIL